MGLRVRYHSSGRMPRRALSQIGRGPRHAFRYNRTLLGSLRSYLVSHFLTVCDDLEVVHVEREVDLCTILVLML